MHPAHVPGPPGGRGAAQRRESYTCSSRACGGAASGVVVLPGAVPERARVGTGPDHRVLGAVRLPASASCPGTGGWPGRNMAVFCNAAPRCRSVWYRPRCEPRRGVSPPGAVTVGAPRARVSARRGTWRCTPGTRPAGSTSAAGRTASRIPRAMLPIRGTGRGALPGGRAGRAEGWNDRSLAGPRFRSAPGPELVPLGRAR
jgi:hypothetical protein